MTRAYSFKPDLYSVACYRMPKIGDLQAECIASQCIVYLTLIFLDSDRIEDKLSILSAYTGSRKCTAGVKVGFSQIHHYKRRSGRFIMMDVNVHVNLCLGGGLQQQRASLCIFF